MRNGRPGSRARALRRRHERPPAGARLPPAAPRGSALGARRLDLRHVGRGARGRDGRPRPPRRARGVRARAPARRDVPAEPAVAAAAHRACTTTRCPATIAERLEPIEELAREVAASPIELVVCVTDVSRRLGRELDESHAFERAYSSRTTPPERDGERRARLGGDQRARPPAPRRRRDRHRRRLGAELPARPRVRQPRGQRDRRLPVRLARHSELARRTSSGCGGGSSRSAPSRPSAR